MSSQLNLIFPFILSSTVMTNVFLPCALLLQYTNSLTYLTNEIFASIPSELVPDLQRMLSTNESFRPTALEFTGT